jgi:type IV secretion system protein VirB11
MPSAEVPSETQARRALVLRAALGPLAALLTDDLVVEVMLNADGAVWVERIGHGMTRTDLRMAPPDAERMLRLIASEMRLELHAASPSLSAKLPPPFGVSGRPDPPDSVQAGAVG